MKRCSKPAIALLGIGIVSVMCSLGVLWSSQETVGDHLVDRNEGGRIRRLFGDFMSGNSPVAVSDYADPRTVDITDRDPSVDMVLPNILMIGAVKASTTAVSELLFRKGVCGGEVFEGEPDYFEKEVHFFNSERYEEGTGFYARRFEHCRGERFVMDATPNYLAHPDNAYATFSQFPERLNDLKLIVILREPISREQSLYKHKVRDQQSETEEHHAWAADVLFKNQTVMSFEHYAETVVLPALLDTTPRADRNAEETRRFMREGLYVDNLRRWSELFGREKLLVLSYDELRSNPDPVVDQVRNFLGMNELKGHLPESNSLHTKDADAHGQVTQRVLDLLGPIFKPKNEELYAFLSDCNGPPMEQCPFPRFQEV